MVGRVALAVGLGFLVAGCGGGSKSPLVASLDSTPTTTSGDASAQKPSFQAFAECMTAHGVKTVSPGGHGVVIQADPSSTQGTAAMNACRSLMPGGGPPALTPSQQAKRTQDLYVFAKCMRAHGVPSFPDPDSSGELPLDKLGAPGPHMYSAWTACRKLFPNFGPQLRLGPAPA